MQLATMQRQQQKTLDPNCDSKIFQPVPTAAAETATENGCRPQNLLHAFLAILVRRQLDSVRFYLFHICWQLLIFLLANI